MSLFKTWPKSETAHKKPLAPRVIWRLTWDQAQFERFSYILSNGYEKTLAHSRNYVTDLSTESGNLFKMAAKIKSERIWVGGLETGEKQTKWQQRQTRKKLKIRKNLLRSHGNTVEWYSDLIFCSMTFICFKPERSSVHGHLKTVYNLISRCRPLFTVFSFCPPWVPEVQFSPFVKGGAFPKHERNLFHLRNFENGPLKPGNFSSWYSKTSAAPKFN